MNAVRPLAAYEPFRAQLAELESSNSALVFDYRTPQGNKDARSHIYKLRQTKAALEKARKDAKAEALEFGRQVDAQAKEISCRLEAMIEVHQRPLDEIEAQERVRVQALQDRMARFTALLADAAVLDISAVQLRSILANVELIAVDESWAEFMTEAALLKDKVVADISSRIVARGKYEAEQVELERLRREAAKREAEERDERIRQEAAEKAKREAEESLRREAAEKIAAAERERLAAQKREADAKLKAERAEREKAEAEARHQRELKTAEEKAAREHAEKLAREAEEEAKREANRKHVAKIKGEAEFALAKAGGVSVNTAAKIVSLIAEGKVPHVRIQY